MIMARTDGVFFRVFVFIALLWFFICFIFGGVNDSRLSCYIFYFHEISFLMFSDVRYI